MAEAEESRGDKALSAAASLRLDRQPARLSLDCSEGAHWARFRAAEK